MKAPFCQSDSDDATLRAHGCALFSVLYLRRWASDGDIAPSGQAATDEAVRDLRDAAGMTMAEFLDRGTTSTEVEKAFEARDFAGRLPPRMRLMLGGSVRGDLLPELQAGNMATVAVNYGAIQDAGKGVTSFRGGHAVVIADPDADSVAVADPLRRSIVRWPIDLLERAMETFGTNPWGGGRGNAGVAYPSPTYREAYTDAAKAIKRTEAALDVAQSKIVAAREQRDAAVAAEKLATATAGEFRQKLGKALQEGVNATLALSKARTDLGMVAAERDALTAGKAALVAELAACEAAVPDCSSVEQELADATAALAVALSAQGAAEAALQTETDRAVAAEGRILNAQQALAAA